MVDNEILRKKLVQSLIIITAANAEYFELAQGTIESIRHKPQGQGVIIGFFDLGCTPEQLQWLQEQVDIIKQADWEFDFPGRNEAPEYLKGLLARPYLPKYFPGFEIYLWIDADAWVQDWRAVDLLIQGAEYGGLAIVPEIDRGSQFPYGGLPWWWQWVHKQYSSVFDEEVAGRLCSYPLINAGVFALHQDAPHWQVWAKYLHQGLQKSISLFTDQTALNLTVYEDLFAQTELLPAWCNWTCHCGLPAWDSSKHYLVEPYLPHTPIGILHLTSTKHNRVQLITTNKKLVEVTVRYASQIEPRELNDSTEDVVRQAFIEQRRNSEIIQAIQQTALPTGDYIAPGLATIRPDQCFPNMIVGDTSRCQWSYLRREIPHNWYVDQRYPFIGFLSRDEAQILYNTALKFKGKRALEIGCWFGWSTCHLALAGVELDVIDPILAKPEFYESVSNSLEAAGILDSVRLIAGYSPQKVAEIAAEEQRQWSLIFIDGNHEAAAPLNDAIACEKLATEDALIIFHDLASPDVTQGLAYLKQQGWQTLIYQTMQIMGVAWRGKVEPVTHQPDPQINWQLPEHLQGYAVSGISAPRDTQLITKLLHYVEELDDQIIHQPLDRDFNQRQLVELIHQGQADFSQGNFAQALVAFQAAIELNPNSVIANKHLNWLFWQQGDLLLSIKYHRLAQSGTEVFQRRQKAEGRSRKVLTANPVQDLALTDKDFSEFQQLLSAIRPYTMLSEARLFSLYSLAKQICLDDIPGNFVECGTWRGGSAALLAFVIKHYSLRPRLLYAFDTFAGMPEPRDVDKHQGIPANDTGLGVGTLKAPILEGLAQICQTLEVRDLVVPVEGLFAQTLPQYQSEISNIALLHADGDWYESTMDILNHLFEQVVKDGIIQIDDYGFWEGCRQAVHEFERTQGLSFGLRIIDDTGVWLRQEETSYAECNHWRNLWYLAQAAEKMGDLGLAQKAAHATLKLVPRLTAAEAMLTRQQWLEDFTEQLKLRAINLIIFPDWNQPEESLLTDMAGVMRGILTDPDSSNLTLLIEASNIAEEEADMVISTVVMNLLYEVEVEMTTEPEISLLRNLSKWQWEALRQQVNGRIRINKENTAAIIAAGMGDLPLKEI
ncbi:MAG: tetratricopeptide repeat protein [Symploca sp. SIO2E6]|nr:tetratricopeptide repeat protein [Symploca sp. SIO2E6]